MILLNYICSFHVVVCCTLRHKENWFHINVLQTITDMFFFGHVASRSKTCRPIGCVVVMLQFQDDVPFSFGQIAVTLENMMASSPKGTFCGWNRFISILFRMFEESYAESCSTFVVNWSQQSRPSLTIRVFSKLVWCLHCNGDIHRRTTRFDYWFLAATIQWWSLMSHLGSSLLQGNSSLVDTLERCYAKLHRRKKNNHRIVLLGQKGWLESWRLWILRFSFDTFFLLKAKQNRDECCRLKIGDMRYHQELWDWILTKTWCRIAMLIFLRFCMAFKFSYSQMVSAAYL